MIGQPGRTSSVIAVNLFCTPNVTFTTQTAGCQPDVLSMLYKRNIAIALQTLLPLLHLRESPGRDPSCLVLSSSGNLIPAR